MGRKILQIVESAYRCTIEEQDDPVLWISAMFKSAGADTHVLLRGNAVNYAVKGQDASGLAFGERKQTQPPRISEDVQRLVEKGVAVYIVEDDAGERGLEATDLVSGVKMVGRSGLPQLFADYDQLWHW